MPYELELYTHVGNETLSLPGIVYRRCWRFNDVYGQIHMLTYKCKLKLLVVSLHGLLGIRASCLDAGLVLPPLINLSLVGIEHLAKHLA